MVLILSSENEIKKEWNTWNLNFPTVWWWWGRNCGTLFFLLLCWMNTALVDYFPPTHTHEWLTLWWVYSLHLHSMISITPRDLNRLFQSLLPTLPITNANVKKSTHLPFLNDKKFTPGIFHTGDKPVMLLKQKQWANNWNRWWASEWTHPWGIQLLENIWEMFLLWWIYTLRKISYYSGRSMGTHTIFSKKICKKSLLMSTRTTLEGVKIEAKSYADVKRSLPCLVLSWVPRDSEVSPIIEDWQSWLRHKLKLKTAA